ncbi:MAG: hypothetical protein K2L16_01110 [Muribaculaceae bacterium]|nr:hypothetical protein [Muribaculaceae bacterium]
MTKYIKYIAIPLAAVAALASCSETDAVKDKGNAPVVRYVRDCDPEKSDSLIVAASLGSKLAFIGENLGDVQQIWFNDQKALLNPTMVTSNAIIVDVPNVIPGEVSNIARLVTSTGLTTEYPFTITVPAPRVERMACEYAPAGSQTEIKGAYFANDPSSPLKVVFDGSGEEAEIVSYTQESITIVVPDGATEGTVSVSTIYGTTKSGFHYADTRGMLFDFERDGATGLGIDGRNWHCAPLADDELALSGTYLKMGDAETLINNDAWPENTHLFTYWAGEWSDPITYPARLGERLCDIVDFSDFRNMSLKFEMLIPSANAWQACAMQLIFSGVDKTSYSGGGVDIFGNTVAASNNSYYQDDSGKASASWGRALYRPWSGSTAFHTGDKWITVTVPLTEFVYNSVGGQASAVPSSPEDFANFEIFVWSGGVTGVDCYPIICIDNIRAVKN